MELKLYIKTLKPQMSADLIEIMEEDFGKSINFSFLRLRCRKTIEKNSLQCYNLYDRIEMIGGREVLHWSLIAEYYSFCVLLILYIRYYLYEKGVALTSRRKMFIRCLLCGMGFILLNVVCVVSLNNTDIVPIWANRLLNTGYFFISICLCSMYAYMMFDALLEHVYDKHCLRRAKIMLVSVTAASSLLTVVNLFTGLVFTIDSTGYNRGPLNRAYYFFLILEIVFLCICYFRNRQSVSDKMIYVIRSVPVIILLICGIQFLFPDILLNGTICAMASIMIFIGFRSSTEDHDAVTGANSRKSFMQELALRSGTTQSVHMIRIALLNIPEINSTYGFNTGDALLYEVSRYLRRSRQNVQVFRTGGTEFTLILPLENSEQSDNYISELNRRLLSEWKIGEKSCEIEVSIAEMREEYLRDTPEVISERLDYTLETAKEGSSIAQFTDKLKTEMEKRDKLFGYMIKALDEKLFEVYYQPFYCCHKDIFCSAEALLRLKDENGDFIPPDVFIPLATERGMIEELTDFVMESICDLIERGTVPSVQSVSINLSMKQLLDPNLPQKLRDHLDKRKIPPSYLKVEITEHFILHDAAFAKKQMAELERLGIEIYMDDFGTGYSNLSSVLEFPFSFIKLDRSIVSPVSANHQAVAMISALTKLFGDMGKRVIAEGVETEEQMKVVREIGVDMIQGYYYAKPMPAEKLCEYFK